MTAPFSQWRPHPWHGLPVGPGAPDIVNAFVEITPFDVVKYEIDKVSGYLMVDRPQSGSSAPPMPYGFIPRTLCGARVGELQPACNGGDGDPMDICVVSERLITRSEVIVRARVIGGFPMVDDGMADDKIVAVLESDRVWQHVNDMTSLPTPLRQRIEHYLSTYKLLPGEPNRVILHESYGRERAHEVIRASMADYAEAYADDYSDGEASCGEWPGES